MLQHCDYILQSRPLFQFSFSFIHPVILISAWRCVASFYFVTGHVSLLHPIQLLIQLLQTQALTEWNRSVPIRQKPRCITMATIAYYLVNSLLPSEISYTRHKILNRRCTTTHSGTHISLLQWLMISTFSVAFFQLCTLNCTQMLRSNNDNKI